MNDQVNKIVGELDPDQYKCPQCNKYKPMNDYVKIPNVDHPPDGLYCTKCQILLLRRYAK